MAGWIWAAAGAVLACPGESLIVRDAVTMASPIAEMITPAMEYCYQRLVKDSSCCLDTNMTSGVTGFTVQRASARWNCARPACLSSPVGTRGGDRIWVPKDADCSSPRVLYLHGGGWVWGSPETDGYAQLATKLADRLGAMVLVPDYPLVVSDVHPRGNFTSIMSAGISALRWLAHRGPHKDCPADAAAPLFIGGDSSGGGSALSLAILVSMQPSLLPGRQLSGLFLFSPWTNLKCNSPEYYHNAFAQIQENTWSMQLLRKMQQGRGNLTSFVGDIIFRRPPFGNSESFEAQAVNYTGGSEESLINPLESPYYSGPKYLSHLPPMYITAGGSESILGDSIVVAQKAAVAGVPVHLDVHPGMWHVFPMYSEGCGGPEPLWNGKRAMDYTALFVRHLSEVGRPPYVTLTKGPVGAEAPRMQPYTTVSYNPRVPGHRNSDEEIGQYLASVKRLRKDRLDKQRQEAQEGPPRQAATKRLRKVTSTSSDAIES